MINKFDFVAYMEAMATNVIAIGHTGAKPRFSKCSGISNLEELLSMPGKISFPHLVIIDAPEGNFQDAGSDNIVDNKFYSWAIFRHCKFNDFVGIAQAKKDNEDNGKIIWKKMFEDKQRGWNGLRDLKRGNISYQQIGPAGDNCWGINYNFSLQELPGIKGIKIADTLTTDFKLF